MCQALGTPWVTPTPGIQIISADPDPSFLLLPLLFPHLPPHSEPDPGPQLLCDPGGKCQLLCDPGSQMAPEVVAVAKFPFLPLWFITSPHLFPIKDPLTIPPLWSRPAPEGA